MSYTCLNEGIILSGKDLYFNMNEWGMSKGTNTLWITGLKGSKTTEISHNLLKTNSNDILINIDEIENLSDNSFIRMVASYNYPTFIQDKTYLTEVFILNSKKVDSNDVLLLHKYVKKVIESLLNYSKDVMYPKKKRLIIEGYQIYDFLIECVNIESPVIIVNASALVASFKSLKRKLDMYGNKQKYDFGYVKKLFNNLGYNINDLSKIKDLKEKMIVNEACKNLESAREFVSKVGKLAKKYDANYFIVTDGASGIKNNGNPAVRNARLAQIKWENENGADPDEDWNKNEAFYDIMNGTNPFSRKTFYHLSMDPNLDKKTLVPRIPSCITREMKKNKNFIKDMERLKSDPTFDTGYGFEEYLTPRVCFSPSIEGCLNAIIDNTGRLNLAGKQIHVYKPKKPIYQYKTKFNKQINKDGDIFDSNITKEMWILEPVELVYIGSIVVDSVPYSKVKKFANNKYRNILKYSYKWHWFYKRRD